MTREQAIAEIRAIGRTCRGPQYATLEARAVRRAAKPLVEAFATEETTPAHRAKLLEALTGKPTGEVIGWLLSSGHVDAARQLDAAVRYRKVKTASGAIEIVVGCGADFNDIVAAGPFDGDVHRYRCPSCGIKGSYRAPLFELEESDPGPDQ